MIQLYCRNLGRYIDISGGETLWDIYTRYQDEIGGDPICALVNNKNEHLGFAMYSPKEVEFIGTESRYGRHVYIRSLCMIAYRALMNIDRDLSIRFEHSMEHGHYCRIYDRDGGIRTLTEGFVERMRSEMHKIVERNYRFERIEQRTEDVKNLFKAEHLMDKVELIESLSDIYTTYYMLDGVGDSFYGPLAYNTGRIRVFDLQLRYDGMLLLGEDEKHLGEANKPVEQPKMLQAFREHLEFNRIIGVSCVGELNRAVERRETAELINVAEALHNKILGRISDEIRERREQGGASIIMMAGPSSSGKTTTSKRLAIQLMTNLIRPKLISLDDYFVDRHHTPVDEKGEYDYESLYALDLERLNSDLKDLLAGKEINLPTYSFEHGCRIEKQRPLKLEKNDVLILEGIHGLNPELTSAISSDDIFKVYVSALTTLHIDSHNWISTSDTRLLRRIVRDNKYRHTSPQSSIKRWPSVRAGEEKWIFPYQENADATFNSSLLFEIGVMKPYAEPLLEGVPHDEPEYTEAYRLLRFLHYFKSIPADQVPSTSLLREFLGGSSFSY